MATKTISIDVVFNWHLFSRDIERQCEQLGLTFNEADDLCQIGHGNCATYASGRSRNPKMTTFLAICNGLDLTPHDYLQFADVYLKSPA